MVRAAKEEVLVYPARVEQDGPDDYAVVFPDVPEAVTGGSTVENAWSQAPDALALALASYPALGLPFPRPSSPRQGDRLVGVPATQSAKLFIRRAMAERGMTTADLARLIGADHKTARRIIALGHGTRMDQLESVLKSLGIKVTLMAA